MTDTQHRVRWFVYTGGTVDGKPERIPRQASMRGQWGYDAVCSCGWDSRTGGGVRRYVTVLVEDHKRESRPEPVALSRPADPFAGLPNASDEWNTDL
jgi:hypothetical protein